MLKSENKYNALPAMVPLLLTYTVKHVRIKTILQLNHSVNEFEIRSGVRFELNDQTNFDL